VPRTVASKKSSRSRPDTSALNADRAATTAANGAVVALASDGTFVLESATTSRVVVDVMAWFVDAGGATDDGRFIAVDPSRVVDTRLPASEMLDSGSPNPWTREGSRIDIEVLAHPDLPDDGPLARAGSVGAVVISVGAISGGAPGGFVGAHPFGTPYLGTSNVNVLDGEIRANMMIVPLVGPPIVSLETLNIADVVVDVLGYITSDDAEASETGLYSSVAPVRIVDSRVPVGFPTLPPGTTSATVSMPPSVTGASAVVQNLTATNTSAPGWLAAHPTTSVPVISNVNFEAPGQTRAALAFTTISPSDDEWITSLVATDVVVDVVGYFSD